MQNVPQASEPQHSDNQRQQEPRLQQLEDRISALEERLRANRVPNVVRYDREVDAIDLAPDADPLLALKAKLWSGATGFALHGFVAPAFWLAFAGFAAATYLYLFNPDLAARMCKRFALPVRVLENKYGFDDFNQAVFAGGSLKLGRLFWKAGDTAVIDGLAVNGSAPLVDRIAAVVRTSSPA